MQVLGELLLLLFLLFCPLLNLLQLLHGIAHGLLGGDLVLSLVDLLLCVLLALLKPVVDHVTESVHHGVTLLELFLQPAVPLHLLLALALARLDLLVEVFLLLDLLHLLLKLVAHDLLQHLFLLGRLQRSALLGNLLGHVAHDHIHVLLDISIYRLALLIQFFSFFD